jgi:hypothetical protein
LGRDHGRRLSERDFREGFWARIILYLNEAETYGESIFVNSWRNPVAPLQRVGRRREAGSKPRSMLRHYKGKKKAKARKRTRRERGEGGGGLGLRRNQMGRSRALNTRII